MYSAPYHFLINILAGYVLALCYLSLLVDSFTKSRLLAMFLFTLVVMCIPIASIRYMKTRGATFALKFSGLAFLATFFASTAHYLNVF